MDRVQFTYKRGGRTKTVSPQQAKLLQRVGLGTYETRDMAHMPQVKKAEPVKPLEPAQDSNDDGLDLLDKTQLHALAKERGVTVHHLAGADKVRAALRGE